MADIRIKDLATLESASLTGDVFVIDGTTGTRKLSAFSPSFGGNATVTGTLTTIGATGSFGSSSSAGTSLKVISGVGTLASPKYSTLDFRTYNDSASGAYIRTGNRQSDTAAFELEIATRSNSDVLTQIATFSDSKLSILATTASTTTSSGALVVSGGVGVAGNIYAGGNTFSLSKSGDNPAIKSTDGTIITKIQSVSVGDTAGYIGTESLNTLKIVTNNTAALTITTAQKAEFASTIKTAAPSGGTAAEWKLGTVATVSPTSPNRTIEVDIGGTIYYIHAKTTNN